MLLKLLPLLVEGAIKKPAPAAVVAIEGGDAVAVEIAVAVPVVLVKIIVIIVYNLMEVAAAAAAAAVVLGVAAAVVLVAVVVVAVAEGGVVVVVAVVVVAVVVIESVFHIGICCGVTGFGYGSGMEPVWIGVWIGTRYLAMAVKEENGLFLVWSSSTRAMESRNRRNCNHSATIEVQEAPSGTRPSLTSVQGALADC